MWVGQPDAAEDGNGGPIRARDRLGRSYELVEASAATNSIMDGWPVGPPADDVGDCQV